jgi:hypothetical protein
VARARGDAEALLQVRGAFSNCFISVLELRCGVQSVCAAVQPLTAATDPAIHPQGDVFVSVSLLGVTYCCARLGVQCVTVCEFGLR